MMRRPALTASLVGVSVLFSALASCTQETVILATVQEMDAGPMNFPQRCTDSCASGFYCAKDTCSDPAGSCLLPPIDCEASEAPVCGCDGITYFNDCLRMAAGIAASTPGECRAGVSLCAGPTNATCPAGSVCAQLGAFLPKGMCPTNPPGSCWVLPPVCPPPSAVDRWDSCSDGMTCLDTCTAIRTTGVYRRSQTCSP
jgi:hypothetical protein